METDGATVLGNDDLVAEINQAINPPKPVSAADVYLGVLFAASNQVNMQGGCFAEAELLQLAGMIVDAPVMVGHKKQELPIGRVFRGEVVERQGVPWLKAYFYWRRDQEGADQLKANIESGVYRECSLAFLYGRPECSVCRGDMRRCRHRIGAPIGSSDNQQKAFFYYKEIYKVLEISLVYRGAVENTCVTTLAAHATGQSSLLPFWRCNAEAVSGLSLIGAAFDQVLVEPIYNGLWLEVVGNETGVRARTLSGEVFDHAILGELKQALAVDSFRLVAQLVPVKGSSRLPLDTLDCCRPGNRKLALLDLLAANAQEFTRLSARERKGILSGLCLRSQCIMPAPYTICSYLSLQHTAHSKGSGFGLLIADADAKGVPTCYEVRRGGHLRGMVGVVENSENRSRYYVTFDNDAGDGARFSLSANGRRLTPGDIIWVRPQEGTKNSFEYVDRCQAGVSVDNLQMVMSSQTESAQPRFSLLAGSNGDMWLDLHPLLENRLLRIKQLDFELLGQNRKFWCELIELNQDTRKSVGAVSAIDSGRVLHHGRVDSAGLTIKLCGGRLEGNYQIETIRVGSRKGYLFSRTGEKKVLSREANQE